MNLNTNYFSAHSSNTVSCLIVSMGLCSSIATQPKLDQNLIDQQYHNYHTTSNTSEDAGFIKELDLLASPSNLTTSVNIEREDLSEALLVMFQSISDTTELSHEFICNSPDDFWDLYV